MSFIDSILKMKEDGKGLMSQIQYMNVGYVVDIMSPCNFLVFGLGEDADTWKDINKGGRTVFLEDDSDWIEKFNNRDLEIHAVEYNTKAEDYLSIGFEKENLEMDLPESILNTEWDIIFVDGPLGHNPPRPFKGPGRMKSIYTAHKLLKNNGICIVDDMGREIEKLYSSHFFGEENLYQVIEDKVGIFKKR